MNRLWHFSEVLDRCAKVCLSEKCRRTCGWARLLPLIRFGFPSFVRIGRPRDRCCCPPLALSNWALPKTLRALTLANQLGGRTDFGHACRREAIIVICHHMQIVGFSLIVRALGRGAKILGDDRVSPSQDRINSRIKSHVRVPQRRQGHSRNVQGPP